MEVKDGVPERETMKQNYRWSGKMEDLRVQSEGCQRRTELYQSV